MKKFYFWSVIALAALSMTSCTQDETLEARPQENAIEFGTYLGRDIETRGIVLNDANLKDADMGVFASYTGQSAWKDDIRSFNFMFNQKVDYDGANWTYSPIKYWPTTKNDKISFWAYAPYVSEPVKAISIVSTNTSVGVPQIKYTLTAANLANAEDFTAEVLMDEVQAGDYISIDSKDRKVNFLLKHELSRIAIKAQLDRDAYTSGANQTQVNIKKIEFGGTKFASEAIYSFGDADNERGTWDLGTVGSNTLDITSLLVTSSVSLGGYTVSGVRVPTTTPVVLFGDDNYLFHIPTNGTTGTTATGDVKLTVEYDIVTIDSKLSAGYSVTPAKKEIDLPASLLAQGKAYNIVLTFGLNEIKLSATVEAWDETPASSDHNVDWPKTDK